MKINKQKPLIHSNSNFIFINKKSKRLINKSIIKDTDFYILNLSNESVSMVINFKIDKNAKLNFYLLTINNKADHDYKINFNQANNSQVKMEAKIFASNNAKIKVDCNINLSSLSTKTIANQRINGFMFSPGAFIDVTPALLVSTNNTKATHAVNIGYLPKDKLFYLYSKGIDKANAINLLIMNEISFLNNLPNVDKKLNTLVFNKIKDMIEKSK